MIKHIVMWTIKEDKKHLIAKLKADLEALNVLPFVGHIELGSDFSAKDFSYDIALYSEFASKEDLAKYQSHPDHKIIVAYMQEMVEKRVMVDYEI